MSPTREERERQQQDARRHYASLAQPWMMDGEAGLKASGP